MEKQSVLLVDDDVDFLEALQMTFEKHGFKVSTASDGEEAIDKTEKIQPDLLVLDVMLPKKDGYAVCHLLKNNQKTSSIPILILTSLGKKGEGKVGAELLAKGHQADGYLEKPVETEKLVQKAIEMIARENEKKVHQTRSKVLVIDDDPDFIAAVKLILEENGYEVIPSYTGEDGLLNVRKDGIDLIILDVMLPGKDGFAVCKELKEDEKTKSIPVMMVTSVGEKLTEPGYAQAVAVTHKADDFLEKPVTPKDLLKHVRKHIGPMRRLI